MSTNHKQAEQILVECYLTGYASPRKEDFFRSPITKFIFEHPDDEEFNSLNGPYLGLYELFPRTIILALEALQASREMEHTDIGLDTREYNRAFALSSAAGAYKELKSLIPAVTAAANDLDAMTYDDEVTQSMANQNVLVARRLVDAVKAFIGMRLLTDVVNDIPALAGPKLSPIEAMLQATRRLSTHEGPQSSKSEVDLLHFESAHMAPGGFYVVFRKGNFAGSEMQAYVITDVPKPGENILKGAFAKVSPPCMMLHDGQLSDVLTPLSLPEAITFQPVESGRFEDLGHLDDSTFDDGHFDDASFDELGSPYED